MPTEFANVTVTSKANVYFDGKVISHSLRFGDGSKKTIGLIYPGEYHFATQAAERMEIIAGTCQVRLDGQTGSAEYGAGTAFDVPANSGFSIQVATGIAEYICSFR
jgi:purine/pyrimidine-nucleoside phosphorylase